MSRKDEQKWQAESDASTMAAYQEIIGDKSRMQRAIKVARERAKDLSKRASAMQSVASGSSMRGTGRNIAPGRTGGRKR